MPGGLGSWRTDRDYLNDSIAEDGQNTETSPGDLKRLDVTQTPVKKLSANTDAKNSRDDKNISHKKCQNKDKSLSLAKQLKKL